MFISFFRIIKYGWQDLTRNLGVSLGNIFIMFIVLCLIGGTFLFKGMSENLIETLQKKVDVSVYFKDSVKEEDILKLKERLESLPQVKEVEYISKEEALKRFKKTHKDNPLLMESLKELEENPLPASLNIRADSFSSYQMLANFLEKGEHRNLIEKINWKKNQPLIKKLFAFSNDIKQGGVILSIILGFIAVAVTFNTIRLGIYAKKEEIKNMKLIGATNWFIRGPFLVEGILVGLAGGLASFLFFYFLNSQISFPALSLFEEFGFLKYFHQNLLTFFLIQVGGGIFLGIFSSLLAIQRYLRK